ncbi:muscarinic acetylcholine receptor M3 [Hydra vulgaris]|uniref:MAch receptor M15 n=1 Tax=Hydra vulgaris TaxID=6087 RepID=A0A678WAN5_HYDVU|nr:muscarinic acetylcholine receptor M3-like [Hydra vulgaris]AYL60033.1 mAch receptor M15 [Hydra vulgaris]
MNYNISAFITELNSSTKSSNDYKSFSLTSAVLKMVAVGILSIITVFGNLLIVLVYCKSKQIRSRTNIPLISLAITDMFIGFYPININMIEVALGYWPLGKVMCNISLLLDYISIQTSINYIVIINFDRHYSIKHPLKHRMNKTRTRIMLQLFFGWLSAVVLWLPYICFYQYTVRKMNMPETLCYEQFAKTNDVSFKRYFIFITSVLGYFLPLIVILVVYTKMYFMIRRQSIEILKINTTPSNEKSLECDTLPSQSNNLQELKNGSRRVSDLFSVTSICLNRKTSQSYTLPSIPDTFKKEFCYIRKTSQNNMQLSFSKPAEINNNKARRKSQFFNKQKEILKQKKALLMIGCIVSAFIITGLPLSAQWFLVAICPSCFHKLVFDISNFITYPNSTLNPFLYALVNRNFRHHMKKLICRVFIQSKLENKNKINEDTVREFSVSEYS